MGFQLQGRLLWCLSGSGLGTTISANGNSGGYTVPHGDLPAGPPALSLARTDDVLITVIAAGVSGTSPTLTLSLNGFDDLGNVFGPLVSVPALTAPGAAGSKFASGGRHGAAAGSYTVFPEWGQVSWTLSAGASFTGVEICVYSQ